MSNLTYLMQFDNALSKIDKSIVSDSQVEEGQNIANPMGIRITGQCDIILFHYFTSNYNSFKMLTIYTH